MAEFLGESHPQRAVAPLSNGHLPVLLLASLPPVSRETHSPRVVLVRWTSLPLTWAVGNRGPIFMSTVYDTECTCAVPTIGRVVFGGRTVPVCTSCGSLKGLFPPAPPTARLSWQRRHSQLSGAGLFLLIVVIGLLLGGCECGVGWPCPR